MAQEAKVDMDKLSAELESVNALIEGSKELSVALVGPTVSGKEKAKIIDAISSKMKISSMAIKILTLLAKKRRLAKLPEILARMDEVRLASQGGIMGTVESADAMTEADLKDLAAIFTKKLKKPVEFRASVDPELLAGLRVTVNGMTYDGTLRAQLGQLKEKLTY